MQYERRGTICNLLARRSDCSGFSSYTAPQCKINCRSMGRILAAAAAAAILQPTRAAATIRHWVLLVSALLVPNVSHGIMGQGLCSLPASKSCHRRIVILLLSNSPSYSRPAFLVFSPAVLRVSPQLKSSNFQNAYVGSTKFQIGSDSK
jgi:hypothetical protein